MPTSYSWNLVAEPLSGSLPNPGTYVTPTKLYGHDARKDQFVRGIKFANVPGGRADFVVHGGARVKHVNSVQNIMQDPSDHGIRVGTYSGAIKFRFRNYKNFSVPAIINR